MEADVQEENDQGARDGYVQQCHLPHCRCISPSPLFLPRGQRSRRLWPEIRARPPSRGPDTGSWGACGPLRERPRWPGLRASEAAASVGVREALVALVRTHSPAFALERRRGQGQGQGTSLCARSSLFLLKHQKCEPERILCAMPVNWS